eukprot:CAMPEP_0197026068 /NCGR_PEP_ID=MMETSP1384-20130603/6252_1 /TAXON_ID=29189 /ORGANISM="Ammonia sp." /LENGTH=372 /DNA_ID=CAMNT_0042454677 /DNA_START=119 /DNA_END=1237 /DNA_ORIENTATION=-
MNGQTFQVNVVNPGGEMYTDRTHHTDDYGQILDAQPKAMCSSLRGESCEQVTNHASKQHNLFNYFPNHATESVVAYANERYRQNDSPYLMKQPMDDRTLQYLSNQNPHILGTKPLRATPMAASASSVSSLQNLAQSLFDAVGVDGANEGPLQRVGSKKFKYKKQKKPKHVQESDGTELENDKNEEGTDIDANEADGNVEEHVQTETDAETVDEEEEEYSDVEVELYSNLGGDNELMNALGLDDEEFGETVDRIVAQLVASYLDNDSEEVDVTQIFANEMTRRDASGDDVAIQQIDLDDASVEEMSELLNSIAEKHKNKNDEDNSEQLAEGEIEEEQVQIFALKFAVDSGADEQEKNDEEDGQHDDALEAEEM